METHSDLHICLQFTKLLWGVQMFYFYKFIVIFSLLHIYHETQRQTCHKDCHRHSQTSQNGWMWPQILIKIVKSLIGVGLCILRGVRIFIIWGGLGQLGHLACDKNHEFSQKEGHAHEVAHEGTAKKWRILEPLSRLLRGRIRRARRWGRPGGLRGKQLWQGLVRQRLRSHRFLRR